MSSHIEETASLSIDGETYQSHLVPEELPYDYQRHTEEIGPAAPIPSGRTKFGLSLLAAAGIAGVTGNLLLRASPWGISLGLWVAEIIILLTILGRRQPCVSAGKTVWLAAPSIFFAATFAWRDSPTLHALSLVALIVIATSVGIGTQRGGQLSAGLLTFVQQLVVGAATLVAGPLQLLFKEIGWRELPREGWTKKLFGIGSGLLIATPLLLLFGSLFAAADSVFQRLVIGAFRFDPENLLAHCFLTTVLGWGSAGFLWWTLAPVELNPVAPERKNPFALGITETVTVLGALNTLFLAFVLIQFRYFFGGKLNIPSGRSSEYAEYARHGFFELVWVSALVLPLLLGLHGLLRKEDPRHVKIFRWLAALKITLLAIIMISAVQRMRLYQREWGLTELRVYTMAFMGWLALIFGWFAVTVLRGAPERFFSGAIGLGLITVAALHCLNPDDLITRVNLQRAREGKSFDAVYTASLSADAGPALSRRISELSPEAQRPLREAWALKKNRSENTDWRSWNWSRQRIRDLRFE